MRVVERFEQDSVYGLSTKKSGRCREVAVSGGSTVLLTFELKLKAHNIFSMKENIFSYLYSQTCFFHCLLTNFAD